MYFPPTLKTVPQIWRNGLDAVQRKRAIELDRMIEMHDIAARARGKIVCGCDDCGRAASELGDLNMVGYENTGKKQRARRARASRRAIQ